MTLLDTPEWTKRLKPSAPHALSKVRQLYLSLYEAITRGDLVDGQQLPSSRQLSSQLSLGRNTVIAVYAQLHDEGLIVSSGRRGTHVHHTRPTGSADTNNAAVNAMMAIATTADSLSTNIDRAMSTTSAASNPVSLSQRSLQMRITADRHTALAPGMPDSELFPSHLWRKALGVASRLATSELGYRDAPLPQLQSALTRFLSVYRSLHVAPEQIIVTSGTRQSLALATALYTNPGDTARVESPGYLGAVDAFRMQGLNLQTMPVDKDGCIADLDASETVPALIYLTPCFQYPTGAPLDASRRAAMLEYVQQHKCMIFEDDYDSEFRDDSQARPALASQQASGCHNVLHAGTFSKLIFPAARIAWLVVPPAHVQRAHQCLRSLGGGHNSVAQATIAEIADNGSLGKHLQRARSVYSQRRAGLLSALNETGLFEALADTGGSLSLVARLKMPVSREQLAKHRHQQALGFQFLEDFHWDMTGDDQVRAIVLGLGNVVTLEIPAVVDRLSCALDSAYRFAGK